MSENHIRGISATLSLLDESLCEFEQLAEGYEVDSVLYKIQNALSMEQRRLIAREVVEMKEMLSEIHSTLQLEPSVHTVNKRILGSCAVLWTWLLETDGRHLRRYGEVPLGLAEYLDPKLTELDRRLRKIADTVAGKEPR